MTRTLFISLGARPGADHDPRVQASAETARELVQKRDSWLNASDKAAFHPIP